jgi:hypothetical protein
MKAMTKKDVLEGIILAIVLAAVLGVALHFIVQS